MEYKSPNLISRINETEMRDNAIANTIESNPVAPTILIGGEKENFFGGANGQALVELHESEGHGEAGGFVLRFLVVDKEQSHIPYGVNIECGTEIHLAGETEARAMLASLHRLVCQHYGEPANQITA